MGKLRYGSSGSGYLLSRAAESRCPIRWADLRRGFFDWSLLSTHLPGSHAKVRELRLTWLLGAALRIELRVCPQIFWVALNAGVRGARTLCNIFGLLTEMWLQTSLESLDKGKEDV